MKQYAIAQGKRLRADAVVIWVALLMVLLPAGCADAPSGNTPVRSVGSGSAALAIHWHDAPELADAPSQLAAALDCVGSSVEVVAVQVWDDDTGEWLVSSPEWACSAGGGTVTGIPVGDNRRFVVLAEDSDGNVIYQGEIGGITIKANEITRNIEVDAYPFVPALNAPANEAEVELDHFSLEWGQVENADQYWVLVATDDTFDDDQVVIDTTITETTYAPTDLDPSTRYYWRIHALDAQLNPSAASQQRWFTTNAHANEMPSATITAPEANATFDQGETITFTGSALDPEEGPLTGNALVWISDLDGNIGSGTTVTRDDLSLGTHTITLTATDSKGASSSEQVIISVGDVCRPPELDAIGDRNVIEGQELSFTVSASDPDEGDQLTFRADRSNLPDEADVAFDADTGEFSWNTAGGEAGDYLVTFEVCDDCPDGPLCDEEPITITVGSCSYTIDPQEANFANEGGNGRISVTASDPTCEWSATENVDWIEITSGGTGRGNGAVIYTVAANNGAERDAPIVAAGIPHAVHQAAEATPPSPDPMTWATQPDATSTSAIRMVATSASDPNGPIDYQFDFVDSPSGGAGGSDSAWQTATTYTDSGLQANHRYGYRVRARDAALNQTGWSATAYSYTLANTPGAGNFSNVAETSIQANWTANGNPTGTQYMCQAYFHVSGRGDIVVAESGWTTNTFWSRTGLTCGTSYTFRVRARNGDEVMTAWRNLGSQRTADCPDTDAPTPDPMTWDTEPHATSTTAVAMTATPASDPSGGIAYQFDFFISNTGGMGGSDSTWQAGTTYTDSGLQANQQYGYRVRARDVNNNQTGWSPTIYVYTDIETPNGITFGTITTISIQARSTTTPSGLTWGSSGLIIYNTTQGTSSGWNRDNILWTSGSLSVNTRYGFNAQARNGDGNTTGTSATVFRYTLANQPGMTYPTFTDVTNTSIRANWSDSANPGNTQYWCRAYRNDDNVMVAESGLITATSWQATGLDCETTYRFWVRAQNGDGVWTAWRDLGLQRTSYCPPR